MTRYPSAVYFERSNNNYSKHKLFSFIKLITEMAPDLVVTHGPIEKLVSEKKECTYCGHKLKIEDQRDDKSTLFLYTRLGVKKVYHYKMRCTNQGTKVVYEIQIVFFNNLLTLLIHTGLNFAYTYRVCSFKSFADI